MDTKGSITPSSQHKSYIHVIVDAFCHFVVVVPIESNTAKTAVEILLTHWIDMFGPPVYLVTDRGLEYILTPIGNIFVHSWVFDTLLEHRTPLGLNDLLKFKTKILVHIFVCSHKTVQVQMYAFAHKSQLLSALNVSPHE